MELNRRVEFLIKNIIKTNQLLKPWIDNFEGFRNTVHKLYYFHFMALSFLSLALEFKLMSTVQYFAFTFIALFEIKIYFNSHLPILHFYGSDCIILLPGSMGSSRTESISSII